MLEQQRDEEKISTDSNNNNPLNINSMETNVEGK